ncbi:MAG: histidine phosphatase family protein [Acidimicrobiales bacterium]
MTRILLVRHGESEWNADGRWQGQADPPLTERGRRQAVHAASALGTIDAIVTSDLERAAETGAILARLLGVDHLATEPRLRERDAGSLSGLTRVEIHERFPGLLPDDPAGFEPDEHGQPRWPHDWEHDDPLWERVEVALLAIGRLVPDGDVVAVTHGGVMYATERRLGGPDRGRLSNLEGCWLRVEDDRFHLGDRVLLVDPAETLAIEADRI